MFPPLFALLPPLFPVFEPPLFPVLLPLFPLLPEEEVVVVVVVVDSAVVVVVVVVDSQTSILKHQPATKSNKLIYWTDFGSFKAATNFVCTLEKKMTRGKWHL